MKLIEETREELREIARTIAFNKTNSLSDAIPFKSIDEVDRIAVTVYAGQTTRTNEHNEPVIAIYYFNAKGPKGPQRLLGQITINDLISHKRDISINSFLEHNTDLA